MTTCMGALWGLVVGRVGGGLLVGSGACSGLYGLPCRSGRYGAWPLVLGGLVYLVDTHGPMNGHKRLTHETILLSGPPGALTERIER